MASEQNIENIHKVLGLEHKHDQTQFTAAVIGRPDQPQTL